MAGCDHTAVRPRQRRFHEAFSQDSDTDLDFSLPAWITRQLGTFGLFSERGMSKQNGILLLLLLLLLLWLLLLMVVVVVISQTTRVHERADDIHISGQQQRR